MKVIAKLIGGSHLYGLATPKSDVDIRYIYLYDDVANIIGLDKNECIDKRNDEEDDLGYEFRRYLRLLQKTNTQIIEFLYAPDSAFTVLEDEFRLLRDNKHKLIDTEQFYKSLRGYMSNELRLALGERTGRLGGKRKDSIDEFGFSPKNFSHLIRLGKAGAHFFKTGEYLVNLNHVYPDLHQRIFQIKTEPEKFTKEQLTAEAALISTELDLSYAASLQRPLVTYFDTALSNQIILDCYYPILTKLKNQQP